jgi:hypothetical protein
MHKDWHLLNLKQGNSKQKIYYAYVLWGTGDQIINIIMLKQEAKSTTVMTILNPGIPSLEHLYGLH